MSDWQVKCLKCGKIMAVQDILEQKPCECGNICFEVIRTPEGKELPREPPITS